MPLSNILQHLLPCKLCQTGRRTLGQLCQDCWNSLPWVNTQIERQELSIQVACHYTYPIDRIIQQFKYEQQLQYQQLLSACLQQLKLPRVQAIVPMPISEERLIERGYNQALLLAKPLARHLKVPIWQPVTRLNAHSQKGLSRTERQLNLARQFKIENAPQPKYKRVLMIDDVVTTGSSIKALADCLNQLGCTHIYSACVAYAE